MENVAFGCTHHSKRWGSTFMFEFQSVKSETPPSGKTSQPDSSDVPINVSSFFGFDHATFTVEIFKLRSCEKDGSELLLVILLSVLSVLQTRK